MINREISVVFNDEGYRKKMSFSKDAIIKDVLTQYLKESSSLINLSTEIFVFKYREIILNKERYLNERVSFLIRNGATVNVYRKRDQLYSGRDPIEFCDVSNGKKELINSNIIYGTPDKGINIYGYCKNYSCIAYNQEVVLHINKKYFDLLIEKNDLKCPICKNIIIPNTVGFLQCEYKINGRKMKNYEEFNFKEIADKSGKIKYYNSKENINGKTEMVELFFEVLNYL